MTRGGKREGAGRKKGEDVDRLSIPKSRTEFIKMLLALSGDTFNKIRKIILEALK